MVNGSNVRRPAAPPQLDALAGCRTRLWVLHTEQLHCNLLCPLGSERFVVPVALDCYYALHLFIARNDFSEGGITAVEVRRRAGHDEGL